METNLTQDYLDRITRSVGGTVAKPATVNVRSDAASTNEAATAVAGAGPGDWRNQCKLRRDSRGFDLWEMVSPGGQYWLDSSGQWFHLPKEAVVTGNFATPTGARMALRLADTPPDVTSPAPAKPTYAPADAEQPEPFCEATGPMPQAFTTIKPKPVDSIEKLIDRLAKVSGSITVNHAMQYRVTGQVEKAEPRTHDEPGYPEHFALHHVYLPEEWTRDILASMSSDLTSKLDKGTLRTVLESAARALLLTGSLDEADLLGLAVAVEDKLDIGK
jgi:hypothetical protein